MTCLSLIDPPETPADDDVIGQAAFALAVMDVTEQPQKMTKRELECFVAMRDFCWKMAHDQPRFGAKKDWIYDTNEFHALETSAHEGNMGFSSLPGHWAVKHWREYIGYARTAVEAAQKVLGRIAMSNQSKGGES